MLSLPSLILALVASVASAEEVSLQFNFTKPRGTFRLPADLNGFSIEADRWPDWAGRVSDKNILTYNLLDNIKQRTGVAPKIR